MYSSSNSSSFLPDDDQPLVGADGAPARGCCVAAQQSASDTSPGRGCWSGARARQRIPKNVGEQVKEELVALTGLSGSVIDLLYSRFRLLAPKGFMSYHCFKKSLGMMALLDESFLADRLFVAFDFRADGVLDFIEWCTSLGIMMKGSDEERLEFSFRILRTPGKGVMRKGNSLQGPLWRGVQQYETLNKHATWGAVYNQEKAAKSVEGVEPAEPAANNKNAVADPEREVANRAVPRIGSRNWVTYLLATNSKDPSNVITISEFIHIVRALENTRSQLTTDLNGDRIPDSVIQDVFDRACQLSVPNQVDVLPLFPKVLSLDNYKYAVTHMPEFLELLGIFTWVSPMSSWVIQEEPSNFRTPNSARRLLSDPGREPEPGQTSVDILGVVKQDLLTLVRLLNQAGYENVSLQSFLPSTKLQKCYSLELTDTAKQCSLREETILELSTPRESTPRFHRATFHGQPPPLEHLLSSHSDKFRTISLRHGCVPAITESMTPSGQSVQRIGHATDPARTVHHRSRLILCAGTSALTHDSTNRDTRGSRQSSSSPRYSLSLQVESVGEHSMPTFSDCSTPLSSARATLQREGPEADNGSDVCTDNNVTSDRSGPGRNRFPQTQLQEAESSDTDDIGLSVMHACAEARDSHLTDEEVRSLAYRLIDWIDGVTSGSTLPQKFRKERMFVNATNFSVLKSMKENPVTRKLPRRPRRRRVETKILDIGGRKGLVVHFGHRSWNLVLNMMLGIRMAAYRCQTERLVHHAIDSYDFLIKETFCVLPRVSNIIDKIKNYNYEMVRFIDYAPMVFQRLRDFDHLNGPEYLDSVGPEKLLNNIVLGNLSSLSELYTEGKSGSIFYYTNDGKFIVKTIDSTAAKLLKSHVLRPYYEHLNVNRKSLIIRIYGFHALKIQLKATGSGGGLLGGRQHNHHRVKKLYFIVMKNIFHTNCKIHRRFDLKGSWVGRSTIAAGFGASGVHSLSLPHGKTVSTSLSAEQEAAAHTPRWWDPTISLKDLDILRLGDFIQLESEATRADLLRTMELDSLWLAKMNLIDYSLLFGIHVHGLDHDYVIPPLLPVNQIPDARMSSAGGPPAVGGYAGTTGADGRRCQYFFGIVDILTLYNSKKKLEHVCKSITNDHKGISCINPDKYQDRFQKFVAHTVFTHPP